MRIRMIPALGSQDEPIFQETAIRFNFIRNLEAPGHVGYPNSQAHDLINLYCVYVREDKSLYTEMSDLSQ